MQKRQESRNQDDFPTKPLVIIYILRLGIGRETMNMIQVNRFESN